jgi:hypothetical protein
MIQFVIIYFIEFFPYSKFDECINNWQILDFKKPVCYNFLIGKVAPFHYLQQLVLQVLEGQEPHFHLLVLQAPE